MLIKYNTTRGLQNLKSKAKPVIRPSGIMQQDCLLLFYSAIFQGLFVLSPFLVAGFRAVNNVGGGLVAHL